MKKDSFEWRGLVFHWFEKGGSQAEGWESGATVSGKTIFFSVREDNGMFCAFTNPPLCAAVWASNRINALEDVRRRSQETIATYAQVLESLQ